MSDTTPSSNGSATARPRIIKRMLAGQEVTWQQLDALREALSVAVFGGNGWSAAPEAARDPRTIDVLDVFHAMELLDPNEPAFSWNRAGLLCDLGQYPEAADEFLEAARKLDAGMADGWIGADEEEWSQAARAYASRALLLAGRVATAAVVWQQLGDSDYRENLRARIELALRDEAAAQEPIEWIPHPRWHDLSS
jgi:tetratricopeptide (TPR) repeat protein